MELLLCIESREVRMVGIWGMAGIGKTTLAKAICQHISGHFEACSFLENVGDDLEKRGFLGLEEKFLSQLLEDRNLNIKGLSSIKARLHFKKVLIVIDDVNSSKILKVLVGKHDWFGQGSRIIVTTRNKHLLVMHGVDEVYEVRKLNNDDALELFSHYAFKQVHPQEDYVELSKCVMVYAQGLPLALKVLGSFLFSKSKHEWESELAKLRRIPNMEIQDVLQVSFYGLDDKERDIFLDIASFFKGEDKDYVMKILNGCGFFPDIGIRVLIEKSLITILDNRLMMHDLLQEMGREIVRQTSLKEPGKHSRSLSFDFNSKCLVDLSMPYSHIKQLWKGVKVLDKLKFMELSSKQLTETPDFSGITNLERYFPSSGKLESLQILILSGCSKLEKFPEIRGYMEHLSELYLDGTAIKELPSSIEYASGLVLLDLKNCKKFRSFPTCIHNLKSLETLIFSGSLESEDVQENFGNLEWFKKLYSNGTAIRGMPSSISLFRNLVVLSFGGCSGPPSLSWSLPRRSSHSIDFLLLSLQALLELPSSIQSIDAHNCTSLEIIPNQSIYKSLYHASFMNCFKLMEYQSSLETLFLTVAMDATQTDFHPVPFNTILPGSGIPDWIGHQSTGCEVNIKLSPNWFNSNFLGFALSAVIDFNDMPHANHADLSFQIYHVWLAYAPVSSSIKWHEVNHIQASFLMITHMLPVIKRFTPEDLKTLREDSLPQILRESTDTAIQLKGNSSQNDIYSLAPGSFAALRSILDLSSWYATLVS
ncbi:putative disease resistance protein [Vitis vinifera]|uniref:ADP-ribosyl cyclase/cyclic ADP-ribose hydrolase n=1 Tax=Vitis vinifera TaxID=29760 RepID=A0A438FGH3_VITVI|nr:putative disease resistance protein [Vitis vinifera]